MIADNYYNSYVHYRYDNLIKMGARKLKKGENWKDQGNDSSQFSSGFDAAIQLYKNHLSNKLNSLTRKNFSSQSKNVQNELDSIKKDLTQLQSKQMKLNNVMSLIIDKAQLGKNINKNQLISSIILAGKRNGTNLMSFSKDVNATKQLEIDMETLIKNLEKTQTCTENKKEFDSKKSTLNKFNFLINSTTIISSTEKKLNKLINSYKNLNNSNIFFDFKEKALKILRNAKKYGGINSIISKLNGALGEVVAAIVLNTMDNMPMVGNKILNEMITGTKTVGYTQDTKQIFSTYKKAVNSEMQRVTIQLNNSSSRKEKNLLAKRLNNLNKILEDVNFSIQSKVQGKADISINFSAYINLPRTKTKGYYSVKNYNLSKKTTKIYIGTVGFGDLLLYLDNQINNADYGNLGSYFLNFFVQHKQYGDKNVRTSERSVARLDSIQKNRDTILKIMSLQAAINASTGLLGIRDIGQAFPDTFVVSNTKKDNISFYSIKDLLSIYAKNNKILDLPVPNNKLPFNFDVNLSDIKLQNFANAFAPTPELRVASVVAAAHKAKIKVTLAQQI